MRVCALAAAKLRVATPRAALIVATMKLNRAVIAGALLLAAGFLTGCSGINAGHSISPATFLLPGLMQVTPPAPPVDDTTPTLAPTSQIARLD
jgi:hypothetical protein